MYWAAFLLAGVLPLPISALIRFPCAQLVTERFDPIVTPGQVSPHVHQIVGGNSFNLSMDPSLDPSTIATCTSCLFKEDKSNYWTAVLYFKHPNGTFIRVPQIANHFTGNPNGGITIYYIQPAEGGPVTAFPKGFRMVTGKAQARKQLYDDIGPKSWALTFRCWQEFDPYGPTNWNINAAPGSPVDTFSLPPKACKGAMRSNIFFPSCWDGKNLDSPDHSSHVAFLEGENVGPDGVYGMKGNCPKTHPVRVPVLFYEVVWDTRPFNDMWPTDGSQPFVLSQGDPTGYGHHGDYLFGWEGDSLQRAMDNCLDVGPHPERCTELTLQTEDQYNSCHVPNLVDEKVEGEYLSTLPGCNPLQAGPEPATLVNGCGAVSTTALHAAATPNL